MAFTLVHRKNGVDIPIKVSLLDVFRPSPGIRPKKPAPAKANDKKGKPGKDKANQSGANTGKPDKPDSGHSTSAPEEYSADDDTKLIEMKANNATWAEILASLGKTSLSQIKAHYKEITPKKEEEKKKKDEEANAKGEKKKEEGAMKAAAANEKKDGKKGGNGGGGAKKGNTKKGPPDAKQTPDELTEQNIRIFVAKYEKDKWLAAASRHYDATGQRISPEMAKHMFDKAAG